MDKPKVLLIEDDDDFRSAVKIALENEEFLVLEAEDGEKGVKLAKKDKPDLIILDVMMPKKDGYAVAHDLKAVDSTSNIPVLMLTSLGKTSEGKTGAGILAKGHGIDLFLEKPVEPAILVKEVKELIAKKEPEEAVRPKVLVIDDDQDFISAVRNILEENQFEVYTEANGEEGLAAAGKNRPDIILVDVMLPEKDGFTVCKELKEGDKTRSIPVIILTSVGKKLTEPDYAKAVAVTHKADDFIEKPVEARELLKHIHRLIGPTRRLV
jgi:DNA-binding response OmpR family regulator